MIEVLKQQIWTESYKVTSFLINLRGQAGLHSILNFIQDVGWQHAIHLGVELKKDHGWVFTRQNLIMTGWPSRNETVTLKTWLRTPSPVGFLLRDYEIFVGDRKIGECTSAFTVMDMKLRKMAQVDWTPYSSIWRNEGYLQSHPEKINLEKDTLDLAQFEVRNSDIDINNHVNNTKYAQWILDSVPIETLRAGTQLHQYEINFLAETKMGDVIHVQKAKQDQMQNEKSVTYFQGFRSTDQKVVFAARMRTTEVKN